jgi:signal transduction histidine kinase
MLKQTLTVVFCLVGSVFVGIVVAFIVDRTENVAIEKSIRESVEDDIKKTLVLFNESALYHKPSDEKSFITKYIKTVMADKVVAYEHGPGSRPEEVDDEDFLFTLNGRDYLLDIYLRDEYLESEFTFLDVRAYAGIAATIIFFTFIVYFLENRKKALVMQQQFDEKHARLNTALQQHEALALLGRMSAALAHELKTPIASISNLLQTFPSRRTDEQFVKRFIELMGEELNRTQQLIDNLLAYGKEIDARNSEWTAIGDFLRKAAASGIMVDIPTKFMIFGDRFYLELLFKNLLRNSREAGADRINIHLNTSPEDETSNAVIACEDNGAGFSPTDDLKKLTDPFVTSRSRGGGLGLYLAKKIATAHGGSLSLQRIEKGARVIMTLPMSRIRI